MLDTTPGPSKSLANADILETAVGENRCVQFSKHFSLNFKLFRINEYVWTQPEPVTIIEIETNTDLGKSKANKDLGKSKALPKSKSIPLNQLPIILKDELAKYPLPIENEKALYSLHNILQNQLSILNKSLASELKTILDAHSHHCNLLASVILHNYSTEKNFPSIAPNQKKILNALFTQTDKFKNKQM